MPTTRSAHGGFGHGLEPAVQPSPATPDEGSALLADDPLDEGLVAGFLLGYRDRTRAAYLADLRDFCAWYANVGIELSGVRRAHVEAYVRQLERAGRSRATVARRLATLAGFYRYAVQEGALPHSPVAHVRRPQVARDSQTLGLDREETVRFLAAAEAASARDHALACLLTLNGLRVSEACAADGGDLGVERAHRVLAVVGRATSADPRTTRRYDRARHALDRHATYTLVAFLAGDVALPTTRANHCRLALPSNKVGDFRARPHSRTAPSGATGSEHSLGSGVGVS